MSVWRAKRSHVIFSIMAEITQSANIRLSQTSAMHVNCKRFNEFLACYCSCDLQATHREIEFHPISHVHDTSRLLPLPVAAAAPDDYCDVLVNDKHRRRTANLIAVILSSDWVNEWSLTSSSTSEKLCCVCVNCYTESLTKLWISRPFARYTKSDNKEEQGVISSKWKIASISMETNSKQCC